jgi:hypothetical protein
MSNTPAIPKAASISPKSLPPCTHRAALETPATRAARLQRRRLYVGGALVTALAVGSAKFAAGADGHAQVPLWLPLTGIGLIWLLLLLHAASCTEKHQYKAFLRRYPWNGYSALFGAYHGPEPVPGEDRNRYVRVYLFDMQTGERVSSLVTVRKLVPWATSHMTVWLCGDPATGGVLAEPGGGGRLALAMPDAARLVDKIDRLPLISLL